MSDLEDMRRRYWRARCKNIARDIRVFAGIQTEVGRSGLRELRRKLAYAANGVRYALPTALETSFRSY